MALPQIALLSNPLSTRNRKHFDDIRVLASRTRNVFHYEISTISDIPGALKQFAHTKPDILIINGGDGTIQATLTHLVKARPFEHMPPLAILPCGKTNMIARDMGLGGNPLRVFRRLVRHLHNGTLDGRVSERALIEMENGTEAKRIGMFFGGAGVVNGILYCRKRIYPLGLPNILSHPLAIITLLVSAMTGGNRENSATYAQLMELQADDEGPTRGRYLACVVTTLDRLLLGMRPYGRKGKGGLGYSVIEHRPGAILRALCGLVIGRFGRRSIKGVHAGRCDTLVIRGADPVTLDGEIYHPGAEQEIILRVTGTLPFVDMRKT